MAAYRFESSPSSRAQCSNGECKHDKVKIQKHELRVGTWIDTERFQSWSWRHWGCTTPKIIENIINAWKELQGDSQEKDYSLLDGYDELSEEHQGKVRKALDQGHVDDEDWNGDVEVNRPGKVGFRVRGGKKAAAKESTGDEEDDSPKGKLATAKEAVDGNEGAATEEEPKADVKTITTKEVAANKKAESTAEKKEPKATAAGDSNVTTQEEAVEEAPQKRGRGRRRKEATPKQALALTLKKGNNNQEEATEDAPETTGRRTTVATTKKTPSETANNGTKPKTKGDVQEETVEEMPKKRRAGRPRKDSTKPAPAEIAKKAANDQEAAAETPKARSRLTRSATKKATTPETAKTGTKRKAQSDDEAYVLPKTGRGRRKTEKNQVKEAEAGSSEPPKTVRKPAEKK